MNYLLSVFYGAGASPTGAAASTQEGALDKLRLALDVLDRRADELQAKADAERQLARARLAKWDKAGAMAHLRRGKMYEQQIDKLMAAQTTLNQQLVAVEGSAATMETMGAMRQGAEAMKAMHGGVTVEAVDELALDVDEGMRDHQEISDRLAQGFAGGAALDYDSDDLEAELDDLQQDQLDDQLQRLSLVGMDPAPASAVTARPAVTAAAAAAAAAASGRHTGPGTSLDDLAAEMAR